MDVYLNSTNFFFLSLIKPGCKAFTRPQNIQENHLKDPKF